MSAPSVEDAVAILGDLVALRVLPLEPNGVVIDHAADLLAAAGARLVRVPDASGARVNLLASLGPEGAGGVLLSGHTDVVPADPAGWTSDPFRLRREGGRLYGRGACDMKGFLACCLAMAPVWAARDLTAPIHIALTYDEEVGCLGAQVLAEWMAREGPRPAMAIVGEPTEMRVIEGHKGCFEYTTRFLGRAGHGSNPAGGVNAVEYAARFVAGLLDIAVALADRAPADSPFTPPGSTLQAGRIRGGSARNVIADACAVEWEFRPVSAADADFVAARVRALIERLGAEMRGRAPEARIETETAGEVAGLEPAEPNPARDVALALTGGGAAQVVPFGTEAGLYQAIGIPTVVCGPGSIAQAHVIDEFIAEAEMARCLDMLAALPDRLG